MGPQTHKLLHIVKGTGKFSKQGGQQNPYFPHIHLVQTTAESFKYVGPIFVDPHFILWSVGIQGCEYQNIQHVHDLACFLVL